MLCCRESPSSSPPPHAKSLAVGSASSCPLLQAGTRCPEQAQSLGVCSQTGPMAQPGCPVPHFPWLRDGHQAQGPRHWGTQLGRATWNPAALSVAGSAGGTHTAGITMPTASLGLAVPAQRSFCQHLPKAEELQR